MCFSFKDTIATTATYNFCRSVLFFLRKRGGYNGIKHLPAGRALIHDHYYKIPIRTSLVWQRHCFQPTPTRRNGFPYESIIARSRAKWRELPTKDNQDYYCAAHNISAPVLSNNAGNGNDNSNDNDNKLFLEAHV